MHPSILIAFGLLICLPAAQAAFLQAFREEMDGLMKDLTILQTFLGRIDIQIVRW